MSNSWRCPQMALSAMERDGPRSRWENKRRATHAQVVGGKRCRRRDDAREATECRRFCLYTRRARSASGAEECGELSAGNGDASGDWQVASKRDEKRRRRATRRVEPRNAPLRRCGRLVAPAAWFASRSQGMREEVEARRSREKYSRRRSARS